MEINIKNCSIKNHQDKEAIIYCIKCERYMCKKCEITHADFFDSQHELYIYDKNNFDKIKNDINIKNLKDDDIKTIKEFINNIKEVNNILKLELEKINNKKEEVKIKIQKYLTKLRDVINKIEDDILIKIDNQFEILELNEKIKKNEIIINKIKSSLNNGSFQIIPFINEINNINIQNDNTKDLLFEFTEEKNIDEIVEKIKNCFYGNNKLLFNSSIIKNDIKKLYIINEWIKEKMDKDEIKYDLIYKMSKDGSTAKDFHKCCDNKGPTLTIIKTTGNQIIGGFTSLEWKSLDSNHCVLEDKTRRTFIFSLNLMKKFEMFSNQKTAIYSYENYGPSFGDKEIFILNDLHKLQITTGTYSIDKNNFFHQKNINLIESESNYEFFDIIEIEVFQIL